ncbi:hypothetical protein ACFVYD_23040 [Streptomyces sp. NPDC058301]|uniref:hypothetical protein n=1 Tax=Streptomyces sp. NPDC058301 TaxID=3346436 RepID=UPI0036F105BC
MASSEIEDRCRQAGLEVEGSYSGDDGPTVEEAFRMVVNVDVEPSERLSRRGDGAVDAVGRMWLRRAEERGLIGPEGRVLVAGGLNVGWIRVRVTPETAISRIIRNDGNIELLARSLDGHMISAIDAEGDDFWLVDAAYPLGVER